MQMYLINSYAQLALVDNFMYYYGFPMKTLKYIFNFVGVFTWMILI